MDCQEQGCEQTATVRLHIPWRENKVVCTDHARGMAQSDGVVATPMENAEREWS
jgi:hypothetical protein